MRRDTEAKSLAARSPDSRVVKNPEPPPLAVIVLNRMGYGPRPGDIEAFTAMGNTDEARLQAYVEYQLHPEFIDESELDKRLAQAGYTTLWKTRDQLWTDHVVNAPPEDIWSVRYRPFYETERATIMRALYSKAQLQEVLADFWHNHFNIQAEDWWAVPLWVHQDRDIIRANSLGNFRKFLEDVATSFPMLLYLDNYINQVSGPNENYARELFELHGLGAENYVGVRRQDEVPIDADRRPMGYVDDDVYEATRAFTGWGVDFETGRFAYTASQHDRFQKYVLGRFLRSDQAPLKDGRDVLDLIASHPGTARHIARKLCRRFISDEPPQRIVDEAASIFLAKKDAQDQLRHVVRTILLSPEFRTTWGEKIKRPFEMTMGCLRAVNTDYTFDMIEEPAGHLQWSLNQAAQGLFRWPTPDGYPDRREKWIGSNPMVGVWRIINWIVDIKNWWSRQYRFFDAIGSLPADVRSPRAIVDFWIRRLLGRSLNAEVRQEIIDFMARGRDPEMDLPGFDDDITRERVWGCVSLILSVPENFLK